MLLLRPIHNFSSTLSRKMFRFTTLFLFTLLHALLARSTPISHTGSPTVINRAHIRPGFDLHRLHLYVYNSVYDQLIEVTIREDGFRFKLPSEGQFVSKYSRQIHNAAPAPIHKSIKARKQSAGPTLIN